MRSFKGGVAGLGCAVMAARSLDYALPLERPLSLSLPLQMNKRWRLRHSNARLTAVSNVPLNFHLERFSVSAKFTPQIPRISQISVHCQARMTSSDILFFLH